MRFSKAKRVIVAGVAGACFVFAVAGCSPQQTNGAQVQSGAGDSVKVAWSASSDCASCHAAESATMQDPATGVCAHVKEASATCGTCHTDESALAKVHDGATAESAMPKKLTATEVDAATCQNAGCHDSSAEEHVALTADYTELVDSRGTQVNPHEVMGLTEGHADITCSNCHNMHKDSVQAAETCVSCHHAGVYECNTCH